MFLLSSTLIGNYIFRRRRANEKSNICESNLIRYHCVSCISSSTHFSNAKPILKHTQEHDAIDEERAVDCEKNNAINADEFFFWFTNEQKKKRRKKRVEANKMQKEIKTRAAVVAAAPITSQTTPKTKREKNISHFSFDLIRLLLWPRAKQIK